METFLYAKLRNTTVFDTKNELFEIELIICMKMDLALNNLQGLICHKIPYNQPNN